MVRPIGWAGVIVGAHAAWQAFSFDHSGCKGSITHRAMCPEPVVLTVGLTTHALEAVTLHNTLETAAL